MNFRLTLKDLFLKKVTLKKALSLLSLALIISEIQEMPWSIGSKEVNLEVRLNIRKIYLTDANLKKWGLTNKVFLQKIWEKTLKYKQCKIFEHWYHRNCIFWKWIYSVSLFDYFFFLPRRVESQNSLYVAQDFGCLVVWVRKRRNRKDSCLAFTPKPRNFLRVNNIYYIINRKKLWKKFFKLIQNLVAKTNNYF